MSHLKLTEILAVYGAALSSVVFIWNISRARAKVRVRLSFAIESGDDAIKTGVGIFIQNHSTSTVYVTNVSFLYPFRSISYRERFLDIWNYKRITSTAGWCFSALSNYGILHGLPSPIEPGQSHYIFVSDGKLRDVVKTAIRPEVRVSVQDALWRNTLSRTFDIRPPSMRTL